LFFMREERQIIELICDFPIYKTVDLGDNILVTHFLGIESTGTGYSSQVFRVLGVGIEVSPEAIHVRLKCVDLEAEVPPPSSQWREFREFTPIYMNRWGLQYHPGEETIPSIGQSYTEP